jgi:hypothetical protein
MNTQPKSGRRAFTGLAGSPLATINVELQAPATLPITVEAKKKRGRPAKYKTKEEKLAADRARKKAEYDKFLDEIANTFKHFELDPKMRIPVSMKEKYGTKADTFMELVRDPELRKKIRKQVTYDLAEIGKVKTLTAAAQAGYLTDAPRGKGKLVTGGYDSKKIDTIVGIREAESTRFSNPNEHADERGIEDEGDKRQVHPEGHGPESESDEPNFAEKTLILGNPGLFNELKAA